MEEVRIDHSYSKINIFDSGGPNTDNIARPNVPFGEIVSLFDPISGTHVPVQIDDNLFCHGAALLANGNVFQAGFCNQPLIFK